MKISAYLKLISVIGLLFLTAVPVISQQSAASDWVPPASCTKALTFLAPKPFGGDNIFKGEAETWLAGAIQKVETGSLSPIKDKSIADYISQVGRNHAKY